MKPIPLPPHAFRIATGSGGTYEFRTHEEIDEEQATRLLEVYLGNLRNPRAKKNKLITIPIFGRDLPI